jgi:hypothetical protein
LCTISEDDEQNEHHARHLTKSRKKSSRAHLADVQETPLTSYICSRLRGENLQLFAFMFAEAIKNDRHAIITPFDIIYKIFDYEGMTML